MNALDAEMMRNKISAICLPDSHAERKGSYHVRSLYFDTLDDRYLNENLAGVNYRHKYRIRIYNSDNARISLERKETEQGLKHKETCLLSVDQCQEMIKGNMFVGLDSGQTVLQEMCAEHMLKFLQPKVIVDYLRIPYVYPAGNVRITFDNAVSSSTQIEDFLNADLMLSPVMNDNSVVFEVKYDEVLPQAIKKLINKAGICEQTAFSKYVYARSNVKNG